MVDYTDDTPLSNIPRAICRDYVERLFMHVLWLLVLVSNFSVGTIERI